jgi:hypothetical protein
MKIIDFCHKHHACAEGREWALETGCKTMQELWARKDVPHEWRIWIATRPGVLSERDSRLFACWCVRRVWHLLTDERSREAVRVAERYARGRATEEELAAAREKARAASTAAWAAWAAVWEAAASEAARAAREAAWAAARAAFSAAAWVAGEASWAAAWAAACAAGWEAAARAAALAALQRGSRKKAGEAAREKARAAANKAQVKKLMSYDMKFGGK